MWVSQRCSFLELLDTEDEGTMFLETSIIIYQSARIDVPKDFNLHKWKILT